MCILGSIIVVAMVWVFQLLWNWLMPVIFDWGEITFWQSAGLIFMAKILFGFRHFGKHQCHSHGWKGKFKDKYHQLSDEDKEIFKEKWSKYCNKNKEEH